MTTFFVEVYGATLCALLTAAAARALWARYVVAPPSPTSGVRTPLSVSLYSESGGYGGQYTTL
jgi:hypothetical protein